MKNTFLLSILIFFTAACSPHSEKSSYGELKLSHKVDSVLSLMTLDEKIGQLNQFTGRNAITGPIFLREGDDGRVKDGNAGSMLNVVGAGRTRELQKIAIEESRLGIPLMFGFDVVHGFKTIFPIPLAEAASWDLSAIEKSARIAATEASAQGIHWTFAPMVDIARDPRWGRIMEGAGEDVFLGELIAAARVRGFQGENLSSENTLLACPKHFAAYGGAEGGRDYNTVDISESVLRNVYLPPFKAAIDAGAESVMNAFNEINGVPANGNVYLLRDILKGEWNFKGMVVSDMHSIKEMIDHGYASDSADAAVIALNAGCDMDMSSSCYLKNLKELVENGDVKEELIDDAVRRILRLKFKLGLFDDPYRYCNAEREKEVLLSKENLEAARDMAKRSIVLLKNENSLLPLSKNIQNIAVIGPLADSKDDMLGSWSAKGEAEDCVTLVEGIENALPSANVRYAKGCHYYEESRSGFSEAIRVAKKSELIILALGESKNMSGEAKCRSVIDVPQIQIDLAKELNKLGKPVVVVLMNGRPLAIPWLDENMPAMLEAWFLGTQAGNAIADVLFGDYNPSGKLTVSFPYTVGQIPIYYNFKNTGRPITKRGVWKTRYLDAPDEPLYPFGYGLSYTSFEYTGLDVQVEDEKVKVSVSVKNTGNVDGEEVVQLYVRDKVASITRPIKELKGFEKILLKAGETKQISFTLTKDDLSFYNNSGELLFEPGEFKVQVGTNSAEGLQSEFYIH